VETSKTKRLISWILSGLIGLMLVGPSALGKFVEWEGKAQMLEHMGFTSELLMKIGVLEVILAVLYLIPRTSFLGAILLTGYLGGATVTHVRLGEPFYMPIVIGVVMWVALGLRKPEIFRLAKGG